MRTTLGILSALLAWALSFAALAWGPTGHQIVGQIADQNLNPHARQQVEAILGFPLATAGPWLDCVKSVNASGRYVINPLYQKPCDPFMPGATNDTVNGLPEVQRMDDYVRRNWSNCTGRPGKGCHEEYHFADVDLPHRAYGNFYGTNPHDIVHAVNAALEVLQGRPAPAPFSIKDKKEALFLLAHLLGDLHQPLHVGSIYLGLDGMPVHPDAPGLSDEEKVASETAGGNRLRLGSRNLHGIWDDLPSGWNDEVRNRVVVKGRSVPPSAGPLGDLAAAWAGDTILEAGKAFEGLSFQARAPQDRDWPTTQSDPHYHRHADRLAQEQVAKAGARLAELLNRVWP